MDQQAIVVWAENLKEFLSRWDYYMVNIVWRPEVSFKNCMEWLEDASELIQKADDDNLIPQIETIGTKITEVLGVCSSKIRLKAIEVLKSLLSLSPKDGVVVLDAALRHEHWKVIQGTLKCIDSLVSTKSPDEAYLNLRPRVQELLECEFEPLRHHSRKTSKMFKKMCQKIGREQTNDDDDDDGGGGGDDEIYIAAPIHNEANTPKPSTPQPPPANPNQEVKPNGYSELVFLHYFNEMVIKSEPEMSVEEVNEEMDSINAIILNVKLGYRKRCGAFNSLWNLVQEGGAYMKPRLPTLESAISRAIIDPSHDIATQACVFTTMISVQLDHTFVSRTILSSIISLLYDSCKSFSDLGFFTLRQIISNTSSTVILQEIIKLHSSKFYEIRWIAGKLLFFMLSNWPSSFLIDHQDAIKNSIRDREDLKYFNSAFDSLLRHVNFWKEFIPIPDSTEGLPSHSTDIKKAGQYLGRLERLANVCFSHISHFSEDHQAIHNDLTNLRNDYDHGRCPPQMADGIKTRANNLHTTLKNHLLQALNIDEQSLEMEAEVQTDHRVFKQYRAGAIILSEFLDNVLLVKSSAGEKKTGFPKGACNSYELGELESLEYAAAREVEEECSHIIDDHMDNRSFIDVEVGKSVIRLFVVFQSAARPIPIRPGVTTSDVTE